MDDESVDNQNVLGIVERAHRRAHKSLREIHDEVELRHSVSDVRESNDERWNYKF